MLYSEKLTLAGSNVLCLALAVEPNLDLSTEAQDALRIMDDRPWPRRLPTGCRNGLEKPASAGFCFPATVLSGVVTRSGGTTLAAGSARCINQDSH